MAVESSGDLSGILAIVLPHSIIVFYFKIF